MSTNTTNNYALVILRGDSAVNTTARPILEDKLSASDVQVIADKRVNGFGQLQELRSGINEVFVLSRAQKLQQVVADIIASLVAPLGDDVASITTRAEVDAALAKLFPELLVPSNAESAVVSSVSLDVERRVFTFEEPASSSTIEHSGQREARSASESDTVVFSSSSLESNITSALPVSAPTGNAHAFKARPAPKSTQKATIEPRMTKAAALRLGMPIPAGPQRSHSALSNVSSDLPSIARPLPKSLANPTIAVRTNKAASIRASGQIYTGAEPASKPSIGRRQSTGTAQRSELDCYADIPGHRRRQSLQPVSALQPDIQVRQNRAAELRAKGGEVVDVISKAARRQSSGTAERSANPAFENTPGFRRKSLQVMVESTRPPVAPVRLSKAAALRMGVALPDQVRVKKGSMDSLKEEENDENVHQKEPNRRSSLARSLRPPTIAPRLNKASALRGAIDRPRSALALSESKSLAPPSPTADRPASAQDRSLRVAAKRAPGTLTARVKQIPTVNVDDQEIL